MTTKKKSESTPSTKKKVAVKKSQKRTAKKSKPSVPSWTVTKPTLRVRKFKDELKIATIRDQAKQLIDAYRPYACMMTINFARRYDDKFLQDKMSELIKRVNKKLFGRAYYYRREHARLVGVCVAEVVYGGALDLCLHFHFRIQPCKWFDSSNAEKVLRPIVVKILDGLRDPQKRRIVDTSPESTDLDIRNETGKDTDGSYLTKQYKFRGAEIYDFIGVLDFDGIFGWNIPPNRKHRDLMGVVAEY